jgi:hypothetical protein
MRIHFMWFLQQHKLYDFFFPLVQLPLESMNYVMACYASHLATGHSLSSRALKVGTIRQYLIAAASFVAVFDSVQGRDARKEKGSDSLCPALDKVLKEQKRWEDVPDRGEGWTVGLQLALMTRYEGTPFLGKHQAIIDWFVVALHGGFRRAEWAQDRGHSRIIHATSTLSRDNKMKPFSESNVECRLFSAFPISHFSFFSFFFFPTSATLVLWRILSHSGVLHFEIVELWQGVCSGKLHRLGSPLGP